MTFVPRRTLAYDFGLLSSRPLCDGEGFLAHFGLDTLRDLPDMEMLEDARLLRRGKLLAAGQFSDPLPAGDGGDDDEEAADRTETG